MFKLRGSLASIVNTPHHIKCISLNNQQRMTQPTLIYLPPNEYIEGLRYYLFTGNLDRCMESCNTHNDLSNNVCVPNEISTKHISCEFKCKFDGRKCNSNQKWNNDKCQRECKNPKEHNVKKLCLESYHIEL